MKKQITVIFLSLILVISFSNISLTQDETTGEFRIGNEPPSITGLGIKDGPNANDYDVGGTGYDTTDGIIDTHDITPEINWTASDPNNDAVTKTLCISDEIIYQANPCSDPTPIVNTIIIAGTDTYPVSSGITYPSCGSTKDYYLSLTPNDGQVTGTTVLKTFTIVNSLPVVSSLVIANDGVAVTDDLTQTHDSTPTLTWSVIDADDGLSKDHWPADTITDSIAVGTICGGIDYLTDSAADNVFGETTSTIPWSAINQIAKTATTNFCARMASTDNAGCVSANYDVNLQLIDYIPDSSLPLALTTGEEDILMSDGAVVSCLRAGQPCTINPYRGTYTSVNIEVKYKELDNDCLSATLSLIHPEKTYAYSLDFQSVDINNICTFTKTIPAANINGIEFFRAPGDYNMNLNLVSLAGSLANNPYTHLGRWQYAALSSVHYPSPVQLGDPGATVTCPDGTPATGDGIQLSQWNPGTCLAKMNNSGNRILSLDWEATDPRKSDAPIYTCPLSSPDCCNTNDVAGCWDLSESSVNFQLDDDSSQLADSGDLLAVFMPEEKLTPQRVAFQPLGGLKLCTQVDCLLPADATLNTYYHINPPSLQPGLYRTTITYTKIGI